MNGHRLTGLVLLALAVGAALAGEAVTQEGRERDRDAAQPPDRDSRREREPADPRDRQPPPLPEPRRGGPIDPLEDEGTEEGLPRTQVAPPGARVVPPPDRRDDWKLGVFAANTRTGVRITRVLPNTAASRVGLERDDVVVTVGGYQVGYVGDRVYSLGEELQRRADARGRVTLLVQNRRNQELLNIEVRLDRRR